MEEDAASTATMTSVTEDILSLDETDTSSNDIDTSSEVTTSEANEEKNSTVVSTSLLQATGVCTEADVIEVKMEGDSEQDNSIIPEQQNPVPEPIFKVPKPKPCPAKGSERIQPSQNRLQFPDLQSTSGNWYEQECFNHYWRHYQFVSMWCQKHTETYKAVVAQYNMMISQEMAQKQYQTNKSQPAPGSKKSTTARTIRNRRARRRRKAAKNRLRTAIKNAEMAGSCSALSETSEDTQKTDKDAEDQTASATPGDENMELEITDEMLDFFAHTHKHRQERDALKKTKGNGKEEKHVNIEDVKGSEQKERTEAAPVVRPGSKRTMEMRVLYGNGAAMIHGMETALQMTFDRNMDVQQPSLWPNMPFRVVF